jgi:hypothetical protein
MSVDIPPQYGNSLLKCSEWRLFLVIYGFVGVFALNISPFLDKLINSYKLKVFHEKEDKLKAFAFAVFGQIDVCLRCSGHSLSRYNGQGPVV